MSGDIVGPAESGDSDRDVPAAEPAEPAAPPEHADPGADLHGAEEEADTGRDQEDLSAFEPDEPAEESGGYVGSTDEGARQDRPHVPLPAEEVRSDGKETDDDIFDAADEAAAPERVAADEPVRAGRPEEADGEPPAEEAEPEGIDLDALREALERALHGEDADEADAGDAGAAAVKDPAQETDRKDGRPEVFDDVERAHHDVMEDVKRAHQSVREMIEQANRDIDEMIRTGSIHDLPDDTPDLDADQSDIDDADIPDVDWRGPEGQGWGGADTDQRPNWEALDDDTDGDDQQPSGGPDDGWDPDVDWDGVPDTTEDDYADIPYMTNEQVEARTQAGLERNNELVSRPEPIRATDYSQEIRPLDEMPKGGATHMGVTRMHVLRADDVNQFATDWNAHIERQQAARYDHRYAQDGRPISAQGMKDLAKATLGKEFDGRHYFQEAIPAVANGRCDPDQLRTVLNELHPELRHQYGMYQPHQWRNLPYVRDSPLQPHTSRQVEQARDALEGYVRSLPDGHRYAKGDQHTPIHTGAVRLRAEIDLYLRTRDRTAPQAIQEARLHRLASALDPPKVQYDRREENRGTIHKQIPRPLHDIYHRARIADPRARVFRLYR